MKKQLEKIWHFLWHEDSPQAWIAQVVIAFVVIKFVLYPLIGLIFGTSLPVVAVVSGSMEHNSDFACGQQGEWWESCGQWYEQRNITQQDFENFPLRNGFDKGDVIALRGTDAEDLKVGDVIVFQASKQYPIIHRIVGRDDGYFITKGDNNPEPIRQYVLVAGNTYSECYQRTQTGVVLVACSPNSHRVTSETPGAVALLDETRVSEEDIIGRAYGRIPYVGYVKILFVDFLELIGLDSVASRI